MPVVRVGYVNDDGCRGCPATSEAMDTVVVDALPDSVRENILTFLRSVKLPLSRTYTPVPTWQVFLLLAEYNHNYAAINVEELWNLSLDDNYSYELDDGDCEFCGVPPALRTDDVTYVDIKLYNRFVRLPRTAAVEGLIATARDDFDYTNMIHLLCFMCSACFLGGAPYSPSFFRPDYRCSWIIRGRKIMPRLTRQLLERTRM